MLSDHCVRVIHSTDWIIGGQEIGYMHIVLIFITNFVLDSEILYKVIGPFESSDDAETYMTMNNKKIEEDVQSSEDYEDDDSWHYSVQPVVAP